MASQGLGNAELLVPAARAGHAASGCGCGHGQARITRLGRKRSIRRWLGGFASAGGSAAWSGTRWALGLAASGLLGLACAGGELPARDGSHEPPPPSPSERTCAWYGQARAGVLYFGEAAFWSAYRASGGDPSAELEVPGPQWVGRFDLRRQALLPALDVTLPGARSGVWDVYPHPNGRIYFTTFFEPMGWVEPESGRVTHLPELGSGLNEIAPGPDGSLWVTRYAGDAGSNGSLLQLSAEGDRLAELPLEPPAGFVVAPKSVAFDPIRRELWVTTDLLPGAGGEPRHDSYRLRPDGSLLARRQEPELQFVAFGEDGSGYWVEAEAAGLFLRVRPPRGPERRLLLDPAFARESDFAQDVQPTAGGGAVVTRWSGVIHVLDAGGGLHRLRLPALEAGGLYYSAVLSEASGEAAICATYCAGVRIVCKRLGQGRLR